jgi:erythromycin esterase
MGGSLIERIREDAIRINQDDDMKDIIEAVGDSKIVLLGEATHGTSEFYTMRAAISKQLIEQKGFNLVAVEGDWPSCYEVNRYVKGYTKHRSSKEALSQFQRWPSWMWANEEIADFIQWIQNFNQKEQGLKKVGFYGLDVYSLWESLDEILKYLERTNSADLERAKEAIACFEAYRRDGQSYGVSASFFAEDGCEDEVVELLKALRLERHNTVDDPQEEALSAEMNALVGVNAEKYYRAMVRGGPESWNIRDHHMVHTLNSLIEYYGEDTKVIVWEHNTHIGDARATDMAQDGMVNVGQLVREQYGMNQVFAIGFGTYQGTVIAGSEWGSPMKRMQIPEAMPGSWEDAMHQASPNDQWLNFRGKEERYADIVGHRAIGVVYHARFEQSGNYVPSMMSARYDGFIHLDQTKALQPLIIEPVLAL